MLLLCCVSIDTRGVVAMPLTTTLFPVVPGVADCSGLWKPRRGEKKRKTSATSKECQIPPRLIGYPVKAKVPHLPFYPTGRMVYSIAEGRRKGLVGRWNCGAAYLVWSYPSLSASIPTESGVQHFFCGVAQYLLGVQVRWGVREFNRLRTQRQEVRCAQHAPVPSRRRAAIGEPRFGRPGFGGIISPRTVQSTSSSRGPPWKSKCIAGRRGEPVLTRPPGPPQFNCATELHCPQGVRQRLSLMYESGAFLKQRIGFRYALILTLPREPSWRLPQRQTNFQTSARTPLQYLAAFVCGPGFPLTTAVHRHQYVRNALSQAHSALAVSCLARVIVNPMCALRSFFCYPIFFGRPVFSLLAFQ